MNRTQWFIQGLIIQRGNRLNRIQEQLILDGFWFLRTPDIRQDIQRALEENREADNELKEHFA